MITTLKRILRSIIPGSVIRRIQPLMVNKSRNLLISNIEIGQKQLLRDYGSAPAEFFSESGFRVHSQFEEDGLILFVFSKIGFTNKRGIEVCCGNGEECMMTNLILYHDFEGLLFDGSKENIVRVGNFLRAMSIRCSSNHYWCKNGSPKTI